MAKRNRITSEMSKTIAESSPLIKSAPKNINYSDDKEIIEVELNNLVTNPFQPRIEISANSLSELVSSIEQNGLLQPIVVTYQNSTYTIIAGHRRVEAYKILGKQKIKATVLKNIHDKELAILSLTENLVRENLHPLENALSIKHILDLGIVESQNKLAEYLGLSKGHVSKMLNMLKLPADLIKMIKEENYRDINILFLLNKITDEVKMLQAYEEIKNLTRSDAEKIIQSKYLNKNSFIPKRVEVKSSKSKINVEISLKDLDPKIVDIVNQKINALVLELKQYN